MLRHCSWNTGKAGLANLQEHVEKHMADGTAWQIEIALERLNLPVLCLGPMETSQYGHCWPAIASGGNSEQKRFGVQSIWYSSRRDWIFSLP